jgi:hypothetical protein
LIFTYTGTIAGKVSVFGEGLFAWGKDGEWLAGKAAGDMRPVFQATVGLSDSNTNLKFQVMGQYFYNGFGEAGGNTGIPSGLVNLSGYPGQHYAAVSISKSELFTKKLSVSAFGMFGLDTASGNANLSLAWQFFDYLALSAGPSFTYTKGGKNAIGAQLTAKLGGGRF